VMPASVTHWCNSARRICSYLFGSCLFMNNRRLGSCRQKYEIYRENRQIALKKEQGSRF
jgi:hypothetical protein